MTGTASNEHSAQQDEWQDKQNVGSFLRLISLTDESAVWMLPLDIS